ncbi:MAG: 30S ribosomal protein S16 [Bacteroidales bacterium]|nr:30S ribosomal protein S16 [Bacteroidales bacterium]
MPVKIRLQRRGRTHYSVFAIVAADSRAPRDGKFIEKLGTYNPNTNPATIDLNFDRALYWLQNGAQPSETARAILSYKGVLMMDHLLKGAKKGAFDEAEAKNRFDKWLKDKEVQIQAKKDKLVNETKEQRNERIKEEQKVNEERAKAIREKLAAEAKKDEVEEEVTAEVEETPEVIEEKTEAKVEEIPEIAEEKIEAKVEETPEEKTEE